jgi:hypothetical protein
MLRARAGSGGAALPDVMQHCIGFETCAIVRRIVPEES